jgi:hypothetical protein
MVARRPVEGKGRIVAYNGPGVADWLSKRRAFLIRGLVLALVAALTIAVAPGALLAMVALFWLVAWAAGLVASLRRRRGTWRIRLAAFGLAIVVLAICHWLPVKYIDGVVGPATYEETTLAELCNRMAHDDILPDAFQELGWYEGKISFTIDRPMGRGAVLRKLSEDLGVEASIAYCGTTFTILWGNFPMRLYIRPKGGWSREPFLAPAGLAGPAGEERVVRSEEFNFEIAMPPDCLDWENVPPPKDKARQYVKAHFRTWYADTNPPSSCDVQLIVVPLSKMFSQKRLDDVALKWQETMESDLTNKRDVEAGEGTFAGQKCYCRDLKGEFGAGVGHISWRVTRMGNYLYVFYVIRTYEAVGDPDLEKEIASIRDSFRFLKDINVNESLRK